MKVIILAAGRGVRLSPLTDDKPKCLVPLRGRAILDYELNVFRQLGLEDIVIVTGWQQEKLASYNLPLMHNARFSSTNMLVSLFVAEQEFNDDLIISYSDIVYEPSVLAALLDSKAEFSVVIDKNWHKLWSLRMDDPLADAETLKLDQFGNIIEVGKKPQALNDIQGQYIGLIKISKDCLPKTCDFYHGLDRKAVYDGKDFDNMFMTSFIQLVIDRLMPVKAVPINGGWLEVDSLSDLKAYEDNLDHSILDFNRFHWKDLTS